MTEHSYVLAVDIGQANDYTALVVLDSYGVWKRKDGSASSPSDWPSDRVADRRHDVVHAERFRGLSYPAQIERIRERHGELQRISVERRNSRVRVVVDATGVGKPILDALREAGLRARGVIITGGETASRDGGIDRVPKRELVTTLQVALQAGRLQIAADLPLAETLLSEFRGFKVKITLNGHARFGNDVGAWREQDHDDLVLATALGTWLVEAHKMPSLEALRRANGLAR